MSGSLAYYAVVNALEAKGGWTAERRFTASVRHALNGHVPYQRHFDAGMASRQRGMGEDQIERAVQEQLALDLNPMSVAACGIVQPARAVAGFNDYNKSVALGVRTIVRPAGEVVSGRQVAATREVVAMFDDPAPCRHATHALFQWVFRQVMANNSSRMAPPLRRLSEVARLLGLENGIMCEASLALETLGHISIPDLARELGCHQRTLERRLREDDLTPEMLRQTARLNRALKGIQAGDSLAEVAVDVGFADQAHMTRAFRAASGMPPSFFKKLMSAEPLPT